MSVHDEVRMLSAELDIGISSREHLCPMCNGGPKKEKAFSITKTHSHIKFHCFRGKCGFSGTMDHRSGTVLKQTPKRPKDTTNPFKEPTEDFKGPYFMDKYGVCIAGKGVKYAPNTVRVLFPIRDYYGSCIGYVARAYTDLGSSFPLKAVTYRSTYKVPLMHFTGFNSYKDNCAVLVEDWISAERIADYVPAIAIIGSNISEEMVYHLKLSCRIEKIAVALDSDMWTKYSSIHKKYSGLFKQFRPVSWESKKDPKDMNDSEVQEVFNRENLWGD